MAGDDVVFRIEAVLSRVDPHMGFRRLPGPRPHPAGGLARALERSPGRGRGAPTLAVVIVLASFSAIAESWAASQWVTDVNPTSIGITFRRQAAPPPIPTTQHPRVVERALKYVGVPYRWGGSNPAGFDCSGFVRYIYAEAGIVLPRTATAQSRVGTPVRRADLRPGDVVFFDRKRHNGIYIGHGRLIHASSGSGRVKISRLDDLWFKKRWGGGRRVETVPRSGRLVRAWAIEGLVVE